MSTPKGWSDHDPAAYDENRPVKCSNCAWEGRENDCPDGLYGIDDIYDRIEGGDIVPVGVCPAELDDPNIGIYLCKSVVHYNDVEIVYRRVPGVLDKIVEAIDA